MTEERQEQYLPLSAAAEQTYLELSGSPPGLPVDPAFRHAAALALSALAPVAEGRLVERAHFEAALAVLRRAGVTFSQVRPQCGPRRLPTVLPL